MSDWRKRLHDEYSGYERAEAEKLLLGLPDVFEVYGDQLLWNEYGSSHNGKSLERFKVMLAETALRLGPPDSVTTSSWAFQETPDLLAIWRRKTPSGSDYRVLVTISYPTGCKIDPRKPRIAGQAPELHPECKAVLADLEAQL